MKPQTRHPPQDDQQQWQDARALLDADPAYQTWSAEQHAADAIAFDAWLDSPDGRAWLCVEEFAEASREEMGYAR